MQYEWIFSLGITNILIIVGIFVIVGAIVQGIFLKIGLGFVSGRNRELGTTFVTALMMTVVSWIPCLGCILAWYFIKSRHDVGWGGALVAWILGAIVQILVLLAIMFLFFGGLFAAIMAGLLPGFPMP